MARRRSIYDASYQTPLADFLEQIPNYFLKWEALKQGEAERKEAKAFRDKQYSDAVTQQNKNNLFRQEQALKQERDNIFRNHTNIMKSSGMNDAQKAQYLEKIIAKDPALKGYMDFGEFESFSQNIKDANTEYDKINDDVDDFRGTSTMSMFTRYQDVASVYQKLQDMEKNVRGTDLEASHAKDLKYVGELKKSLETLSGKEMAEKDMPETMQRQFSSIVKSNDAEYKSLSEAADELSVYADYNPKTRKWDKRTVTLEEFSGGQANLDRGYNSAIRAFKNAESRFNSSSATRNTFTKQQGLFYPEITTAQQQEELDVQSEARTTWFNENESYINTDPATAELALQYLEDPSNADRFSALQESVSNRKSDDDFMAMLDRELGKEGLVVEDKTDVVEAEDTREPYEIGAMEPATEFEPGADITDEDVDAVLADVRETTGFYPEGDAPREPETKPKPKPKPKLPRIAETLTARSDVEKEKVVAEKEKELAETPLFKEPVKVEDLKNMNIKDSKGESIKFESAKQFDKQINSMYNEIQNIGKRLTQAGASREQREEMKKTQKRIAEDLIKTLDILNISKNANVKDRNLKSTMNQFLKKKKFRDPDALIKFLEIYI